MEQVTRNKEQEILEKNIQYFNGDELAAKVVVEKYLVRDYENNLLEETLDDVYKRVSHEIIRIQNQYSDGILDYDSVFQMFKNKKAILQGSPLFGIGNKYSLTTLSNCYVVPSPHDSITGIMDIGKELAILFKSRGGAGVRIDSLRPEGFTVANSARFSTGAWSFASLYSDITKAIGQHGRRGALMIAMIIRHPDILKFIRSKNDKVSITSANISVLITDDFMRAVENNELYELRWPVEGEPRVVERVPAREIWNAFVESNIGFAEPGALFWDRMEQYTPNYSYEEFRPVCVNPCAEVAMGPRSNCRLGSINLFSFVKNRFSKDSYFDFEEFKDIAGRMTVVMDNLVDLDLEKMESLRDRGDSFEKEMWSKYIQQTKNGREIGIGTHGLGDCLASLGVVYGSDESLEVCDKIYRELRNSVYKMSQTLAKHRGAFPLYSKEKEEKNLFISEESDVLSGPRRNVSLLTSAPTGSISIIHQVSSGIEPIFQNYYIRRKKTATPSYNTVVGSDGQIYEEFVVYHPLVKMILDEKGKEEGEKYIQEFCVNAHQVHYKSKINLQSVIQKYIDHSISNTYNLPKTVSIQEVSDLYMYAWKKGLKGITIYVDGSRDGILIGKKEEKERTCVRPEFLPCEIHHTTIHGKKWVVFVGMLSNKPYEVFCGLQEFVELNQKYKTGIIQKVINKKNERNTYNLIVKTSKNEEITINDIVKIFGNEEHSALGRMISLSLRSGVKISKIVEQLLKDQSSDFVSYSKVLARILKKYIPNGEVPDEGATCPLCGGSLVYEDGCKVCKNCGWGGCS